MADSPPRMTFEEASAYIASGCDRQVARFALTKPPPGYSGPGVATLMVGSWRCTRAQRGFLVSMGLTREQLEFIRDECQALLDESPTS